MLFSAIGQALQAVRIAGALDDDPRGRALYVAEISWRELDGSRADVLVQAFQFARSGDGHDPPLLGQQPGQRDLRGRGLLPLRDGADQIDQG